MHGAAWVSQSQGACRRCPPGSSRLWPLTPCHLRWHGRVRQWHRPGEPGAIGLRSRPVRLAIVDEWSFYLSLMDSQEPWG